MHVQVSAPSVLIDSWSGHANKKKRRNVHYKMSLWWFYYTILFATI